MMAFYAESGGHVAKRPRVDYHQAGVVAQAGGGGGGGGGVTIPAVMSPQYIEQQLNKKPAEPEKPNHILLFTVFNPNYPITCEVLHTICSPMGKVLRIVIFRKNGVQAMVEFETLEAAKAAKESLYGCDIYSGCCTLKVEFAKPAKLNVYKNDSDSFDYTNPNPGKTANQDQNIQSQVSGPQRPVLLKEPLVARQQVNGNGISHAYENGLAQISPAIGSAGGAVEVIAGSGAHGIGRSSTAQTGNNYFRNNSGVGGTPILATPISLITSGGQAVATTPTYHNQGSVCMVYGLNPDKMNANRLFNLFCLYGNVTRVKFLKTKEGCAMVQLGDSAAVERAIANLNNTIFFGTKMQLGFSKQAFLADVQSPYQLPDGTPSFQDFMGNKNNRFMNPEMASKNRIQPPSKILHFFNTPPGLDEKDVEKLFTDNGAPRPKCVKLFPSKTDRSSSGLIEFASQGDALEGLVCCNHLPVNNPSGKFPYIMKLCFSSSRNIPTTIRQP